MGKIKQFVAMPNCFFCNESKDEILLSRRLEDISALDNKVIDMEPCTKCRDFMSQGVIFCSVKDGEMTSNPNNPYRTGGWWVMKEEAAVRIFPEYDFKKNRFVFIEDSL